MNKRKFKFVLQITLMIIGVMGSYITLNNHDFININESWGYLIRFLYDLSPIIVGCFLGFIVDLIVGD